MYSAINHSITHFDITSEVTYDTVYLRKIDEQNFFIRRIKTNLKLFDAISENYCIYEPLNIAQVLNKKIEKYL